MDELKERVFQYRINNTENASEQAQLIRERNIELHNATREAQTYMDALVLGKQSGEITQEQFVAAVHLVHQKTKNNVNNSNGLKHAASNVGQEVLDEAGVTAEEINNLISNAEEAKNKVKKIKEEHGQGQGQGQGNNNNGNGNGHSQGHGNNGNGKGKDKTKGHSNN